MNKHLSFLIIISLALFSSCKAQSPAVDKKELSKEERITERTEELEKIIENKVGKSDVEVKSSAGNVQEKHQWGNAPDFTLENAGGGKLTLSDYSGKVIILDFWATWCGPCRMGIPEFIKLYNSYRDKGLVVIGVDLDKGGKEAVVSFINEMKMNYPVVYGNSQVEQDFGGIRGIPTAFIIDRNGNIVNKLIGYRQGSEFEEEIKKLL